MQAQIAAVKNELRHKNAHDPSGPDKNSRRDELYGWTELIALLSPFKHRYTHGNAELTQTASSEGTNCTCTETPAG